MRFTRERKKKPHTHEINSNKNIQVNKNGGDLIVIFMPLCKQTTTHLLCDKNLPVEWPEPSHPGIGHLENVAEKINKERDWDVN